MQPDHVLTHVAERDADLLLVEEFCCSLDFFNWFSEQLRPVIGDSFLEIVGVRHSVSTSGEGSGETDIEVTATLKSAGESCKVVILIEDKIDATFTERQPDRYGLRARELIRTGACGKAILVLLAPAAYTGAGDGQFDVRISYEKLIDYFGSREQKTDGELRLRCQHRRRVLEQALYRFRRGYVAVPVEAVTNFWEDYWKMCMDTAPTLLMVRPNPKPGDSYSVSFPCLKAMPGVPRASLYHVMRKGTVDLLFAGSADSFDELTAKLGQHLDPDMKPRRASKSFAITILVPALDTMRPLAEQADIGTKSLEAALRLKDWHEKHALDLVGVFLAINNASRGSHGV